jgi:rhodanese-related sulfurtransferase
MKKLTKLMLLMTVLATPVAFGAAHDHDKKADAPAAKEYKYKTPKLNRAQLDALLAKPEQLLIIDVRRPDELTKIGGFPVYLSIQSKEIENSLAFIPKDRDIVTVSNHAGRAGAAGDLLTAKGFKVVGAVGAQNYEEEGGKLAKIAVPAPKSATEQK